ncbi:MAG: hypothetical protein IIC74_02750 [Bacteroidetes bacterium]|nr:hypothetical protein [Bacteroidota bacterium]
MKKYIVGTLIFIIVTFIVQSTSHFVVNQEHYAEVLFMRKEVIFPLGFLTMTLQGIVLSFLFSLYNKNEYSIKKGFQFGLIMSAFFVSYTAFTEPAKYQVQNIVSWILVEGIVGLIQFCLFGILLSILFNKLKQT